MVWEFLLHALNDTWPLLPWVLLIYVLIELLESKTNLQNVNRFGGKLGPLAGAATGLIPQCGFSVMAAKLFERKYITIGTLLAIFFSTSDEAFIILLSDGASASYLLPLFVSKILLGALVGYGVDTFLKWIGKAETLRQKPILNGEKTPTTVHEIFMRGYLEERLSGGECVSCGREHDQTRPIYTYLISPALHALKVAGFIFLVNFALGYLIELVGENAFSAFMQRTYFYSLS